MDGHQAHAQLDDSVSDLKHERNGWCPAEACAQSMRAFLGILSSVPVHLGGDEH